jgi:hypothetical protein
MPVHLAKEAALTYFELSQVTYYFGLISQTHWIDRLAALRLMCAPDDPTRSFANHILQIEEWETADEWPEEDREPQAGSGTDPQESRIEPQDDFPWLLKFIPGSATGLSHWIFNIGDPDFFPSIPHGHYQGHKWPKLDAYLGWTYTHSRQGKREPRQNIIALWNDDKFRDFALRAINWYIGQYPNFQWRVPNPLRLPKKRRP